MDKLFAHNDIARLTAIADRLEEMEMSYQAKHLLKCAHLLECFSKENEELFKENYAIVRECLEQAKRIRELEARIPA